MLNSDCTQTKSYSVNLIPTFPFFFLPGFCSHNKSVHTHTRSSTDYVVGFMHMQQRVDMQVFCKDLSYYAFHLKENKTGGH